MSAFLSVCLFVSLSLSLSLCACVLEAIALPVTDVTEVFMLFQILRGDI